MEAAGWQQYHRIPAFGDWNYDNNSPRNADDDGGVVVVDNHWPPVIPCFGLASSAMRTAARPAAQHKSSSCDNNKRSTTTMPNARRMRIPAFGEWNHHGGGDVDCNGIGNGTWPAAVMTPFFDLPAPQKAPKTGRRRHGDGDGDGFDAANKLATTAAAELPQGHMQTRRSKVADSAAYAAATAAAARRSCFTVAKPVDDDLYGVPPDMLYGKPSGARKAGWLRILRLLGCSCSCSCFSPSS